jgi:hypothetical protein
MRQSIFNLIFNSQQSVSESKAHSGKLNHIKSTMLALLSDASPLPESRLVLRINAAGTGMELWLLRVEVHQAVALAHGQSVAAQRINGMLPLFELLIPAHMLAPV